MPSETPFRMKIECATEERNNHSSSQQRLDQQFYVLTLNFEIPQVAYFQSFYAKIVIFLALHHVTF